MLIIFIRGLHILYQTVNIVLSIINIQNCRQQLFTGRCILNLFYNLIIEEQKLQFLCSKKS